MTAPIEASKVRRGGRDDLVGLMTRWERVGEETSCKGAASGSQDGLKIQQSFLPFLQFEALRADAWQKSGGGANAVMRLSSGTCDRTSEGRSHDHLSAGDNPFCLEWRMRICSGAIRVPSPGSRPQGPVQRSRPQVPGRSPGGRMTVRLVPPRDWPPGVKRWWDATASSRPEVEFLHSSTSPRPGFISR